MKKDELIKLLQSLADADTNEGHDVNDHPCCVAIRAIEMCFDDIKSLRRAANKEIKFSKKVEMLIKLEYNPDW